jgi:hypothetical protein
VAGSAAGEWRHDDAIGKLDIAEGNRVKQIGHGKVLLGKRARLVR